MWLGDEPISFEHRIYAGDNFAARAIRNFAREYLLLQKQWQVNQQGVQ